MNLSWFQLRSGKGEVEIKNKLSAKTPARFGEGVKSRSVLTNPTLTRTNEMLDKAVKDWVHNNVDRSKVKKKH